MLIAYETIPRAACLQHIHSIDAHEKALNISIIILIWLE